MVGERPGPETPMTETSGVPPGFLALLDPPTPEENPAGKSDVEKFA
jgi:hypothetical protein